MRWETMPQTDRILSNGLHLITEPIAATKTVAIGFWFSRGSRDEEPGDYGITHFIEHMLFKGTPSHSAYDIARFFDRIGGYINAFTERELMCLYCVIPHDHAKEAIDILVDMIRHSLMDDAEIEKERSVIVSEILASLDDAEEMGIEKALEKIFLEHGLARPIAASVHDVESLECPRIRDYYRACFQNSSPLVTVAGNIQASKIQAQLEALSFQTGKPPALDSSIPLFHSGNHGIKSRFGQSQIMLSYPIPRLDTEKDWFSWSIINAIIGDTVSSRLFQSLREQRGLCYSLFSFTALHRDSFLWAVYTATPPEKTAETVKTLRMELDLVGAAGFSEVEIADAKSHLTGEMLLSLDDIENRMKRLARQFLYNGQVLSIEESMNLLIQINADDINDTAKSVFVNKQESLTVYGPKRQVKEFNKHGHNNFIQR